MKKIVILLSLFLLVLACQKQDYVYRSELDQFMNLPTKDGFLSFAHLCSLISDSGKTDVKIQGEIIQNGVVDTLGSIIYLNERQLKTPSAYVTDSTLLGKTVKISFKNLHDTVSFYVPTKVELLSPKLVDNLNDNAIGIGLKLTWIPDFQNKHRLAILLRSESVVNEMIADDNGECTLSPDLFRGFSKGTHLSLVIVRYNTLLYKINGEEYKILAIMEGLFGGIYR